MKLLLISSEPLNPDNILTSTFELTQAVLLRRIARVSILSVSLPRSVAAESRRWLAGKDQRPEGGFGFFLRGLLPGPARVNRYEIEGIPVYEGNNFKFYSKKSWEGELRDWVRAGHHAFRRYVKENGYPDFIHSHGRFISAGALALAIHREKQIPFIYTEHATAYQTGQAPPAARPVLDLIIKHASAVIAVSQGLLVHMESFLGRRLPQAIIQPNVLDPVFEDALPGKKTGPATAFICIASFHEKKGLGFLVRAFAEAFSGDPAYTLTLCGEGPLRAEIEELISEKKMTGQIVLTGNIAKNQIRDRLDQCQVLIVSSLEETFGVAVIEALARGCAVLATRSGGPETILTAEDGILVEPGNVAALTEGIKRIAGLYAFFNPEAIRTRAITKYGSVSFLKRSRALYNTPGEKKLSDVVAC